MIRERVGQRKSLLGKLDKPIVFESMFFYFVSVSPTKNYLNLLELLAYLSFNSNKGNTTVKPFLHTRSTVTLDKALASEEINKTELATI
jgi:hypothetical protein